jgi:methyl-accepting chemotaxis protein
MKRLYQKLSKLLLWNQHRRVVDSQASEDIRFPSQHDYSLPQPVVPVESEIASCLPVFPVLSAQLKETITHVEEAVVEICSGFQGISARAQESVSRAVEFLDSHGRESKGEYSVDGLIKECSNTMENLLDSIDRTDEVSRKAVEQIQDIDAYAKEINLALNQLHGIAEGNKILAINARIEAAHAGAQGAGFSVVADEVNLQAQRSCEVIEKVGGLAGNLRNKANSAVADLDNLASRSRNNARESKKEVTDALNAFSQIHARMETLLSAMAKDSQVLSGEISTAIHGLQFQDRTSQRVTHVIEALDSLHQRFSELCQGYEPSSDHTEEVFKLYTMKEEWQTAGVNQDYVAGEVELF